MDQRALVALLYDARNRSSSIYCRVLVRHQASIAQSSVTHRLNVGGQPLADISNGEVTRWRLLHERPSIFESDSEVWWNAPWSFDVHQKLSLSSGETTEVFASKEGDGRWTRRPSIGDEQHTANVPLGLAFELVIDPARLLATFDLVPAGSVEWRARSAVIVDATHRVGAPKLAEERHPLGMVNSFRLLIDDQRGVLIRATATRDEQPLDVIEVLDIEFDSRSFPPLARNTGAT